MADLARLDARKAAVLRAIVSQFVRSGEPVGSKTIVEKFSLGVSAATVRNEMAALEDAGFIYQPHTSAGRVPTDAGYRYFVDAWGQASSLPARDAARVRRFFTEPRWELGEALRETASLLSRLTDTAAVVFAPSLDRSVVRHVELVRLSSERAMILLVTDTGRVTNFVVLMPERLDDVQLEDTAQQMNRLIADCPLDDTAQVLLSHIERFALEARETVKAVATSIDDELSKRDVDRIFLEGTSTIVDEHKFADLETVRQVVGALEHRRLVLEVLADALADERVSVRIGSENAVQQMQYCSVITAPYGSDAAPIGSLGVVGPTRMDYGRSIAAVHEVAGALGRMLSALGL